MKVHFYKRSGVPGTEQGIGWGKVCRGADFLLLCTISNFIYEIVHL